MPNLPDMVALIDTKGKKEILCFSLLSYILRKENMREKGVYNRCAKIFIDPHLGSIP